MQYPEHTLSSFTRGDPEDAWRVRSEIARERQETARTVQNTPGRETRGSDPSRRHGPMALARDAASEAWAEYMRTVKGFTDPIVGGRIPEEQSGANANGAEVDSRLGDFGCRRR
jgi:hypothetical protein